MARHHFELISKRTGVSQGTLEYADGRVTQVTGLTTAQQAFLTVGYWSVTGLAKRADAWGYRLLLGQHNTEGEPDETAGSI